MGLVKRSEAADAASVASRSKGVSKVIQVFEFID
jgi:osmotically-inducible protein OsmY